MTKDLNIKKITGLVFATIAMLSVSVSPIANAADDQKLFIQVSPVMERLELDPGNTYHGTMKVANSGSETYSYKLSVDPFYVSGDNYDPSYTERNNHTLIADWITFDRSGGTLAPGEREEVSYTIEVPSNAPGGAQSAALIAEGENEKRDLVNTTTRVAELIYATVSGDINECAKVLNNSINTFMFEPPISANSLVENCGNMHLDATYTMRVYPLFSDKVVYTNEENPTKSITMPETKLYRTLSWSKEDGAPMMGIYNVEQIVKIGKETSTIKKLVFIFPLWLIIIFILLIAAIVFWLVSRSRQRKESKRSSVNTPTKD